MNILAYLFLGVVTLAVITEATITADTTGMLKEPKRTATGTTVEKEPKSEEERVKERMESDIKEYEEMKKRIRTIQQHLRNHADFHLIDGNLLKTAKLSVDELERTIIVPLEGHLVAVRDQVSRLNHTLADQERTFISDLLDNSEKFLHTSKTRLMSLEVSDQDWFSDEKVEKIRQELQAQLDKKSRKYDFKISVVNSRPVEMGSTLAGPRGERLGNMKNLRKSIHEKKMKMLEDYRSRHATTPTPAPKVEMVDLRRVKEELDRERMMDLNPGYDKKIKLAMAAAAEKSHQFIRDKLAQAHNERAGLMMTVILLVLVLVIVSAVFTCRKRKRAAARIYSQGAGAEEGTFSTSELTDMARCQESQGFSGNGLSNPWSGVWTTWESDTRRSKESQKLK